MSARATRYDKWFLASVIVLTVGGFFIFISASLGLLAQEGPTYSDVVTNQFFLGLLGGIGALLITSHIHYKWWRKYAFYLFAASLVLSLLVFIPSLGMSHGGATRWLDLGPLSFQPAEALKIGFIIYFAAWLSGVQKKVHTWLYGLLPLVVILAITGGILLLQPDTDTFVILSGTGLAMFFVAGARIRHILLVIFIGMLAFGGLLLARPYLMERMTTYLNPASDPLGASYQVQQSLIAIGSGNIMGRGFGQSVQKFNFLPEPIGDSIYAVAAEEFGFVGSIAIIGVYIFFAGRGLFIAIRAPDTFSRLLVVGIVILIVVQSLMNIAAMLGVIPLSGMPLLFISHGGSALAMTLAEVGIILNVSKHMKSGPQRA